ncbi:transglycosylase SLT domain-containing protein [Arenicella sp.]|nr:transglycosylase SLT domain-containing protein [Arenicella sp.]
MFLVKRIILIFCLLCLAGCATRPPADVSNICAIFKEHPKWYKSAKASSIRWGGPIQLPMAIMYQESAFKHNAKPPMQYFLWFIPTGRASNAYGYAQALQSTWAEYQREVGSRFRDRDNFANAYDFIQWYMHKTYQRNGVSKWDYYAQYLNYHEGQGGYSRGTHNGKQWLLNTAQRVDQRAKQYAAQIQQCLPELDKMRTGWFS